MALEKLGELMKNEPWKKSVLFSVMLIILEKIVEHDFECPCDRVYTLIVLIFYFWVPMFVAVFVGIHLVRSEVWKESEGEELCCSRCKMNKGILKIFTLIAPPGIWLALFLSDGRYVSCYMTKLTAEYADSNDKPPWEWCSKIRNLTDDQNHVYTFFYWTKFGGFLLVLILIFILAALITGKKSDRQSNQADAVDQGEADTMT